MKDNLIKAYFFAIFGGLVILAAVLLVIMQWGNHVEFNLYGTMLTVDKKGGKIVGGVDMALLMLLSAAGGVVLFWLTRRMIRGIITIGRARRAAAKASENFSHSKT